MNRAKLAITLDRHTLDRVDQLISRRIFPNRSRVIQEAVEEKLKRLERSRLALECANLNPAFEKALAEEGLSEDSVVYRWYISLKNSVMKRGFSSYPWMGED